MASNLLKTLKKIDDGRLECIRVAKQLGHNVSDNASLQDIANCLVQAGFPKYYPVVDIDAVRASRKKWVRPANMYDLEPIYNAAEVFTGTDGNVYYPLYVMSFNTSYASIQINKNNLLNGGVVAVKTSDGVTYEDADITTTAFTHTWDSSVTDKYYVVVYGTETYYNKTTAIQITTALNHYETMEIYAGAGHYTRWVTHNNYTYLVSVVFSENTTINSSSNDFFICSSTYMRHLVLNSTSVGFSSNSSGRYFFRNLNQLQHFELLHDTGISGGSGTVFSDVGSARMNGYLTYFNAPNLGSIGGYSSMSMGGDTSIVDLPNLTNWLNDKNTTHTFKSMVVNIPKWPGNKATQSIILDGVVVFNYKEGLALSNLTINAAPAGFKFDKTIVLAGNLNINCYMYSIDLTVFDMNPANINAPKVENIKFPAVSQSFDLSKYTMLSKNSIIEFLDALPITDNGYTITLADAQKSKLSESELRIATDKGWVIA